VEGIERLLNAKETGGQPPRTYTDLQKKLTAAFFGEVQIRRHAPGFEPIPVRNISNGVVDPVEFVGRAYDHWEHGGWPGRNIRRAYAHTLFALVMLKQLEEASLLMLEEPVDRTAAALRQVQSLLDRLNAAGVPNVPVFVRDARWLIQTAQSPATQDLRPYFAIARQLSRVFSDADRLEIHKAGAKMTGGHLRSQLRYRSEARGVSIDDVEVVAYTRTSNAMDHALLVYDLVSLLDAYDAACGTGDTSARRELADAILQGVSIDPELFLVQLDLLAPCTIVEHLFVERGSDGQAQYTDLGHFHVEHLRRYHELIGRLASALREDAAAFAPSPDGYSPYGIAYGFTSDIVASMATRTLIVKTAIDFSLEDAFVASHANETRRAWGSTRSWTTRTISRSGSTGV
jgi:hypothetical protein